MGHCDLCVKCQGMKASSEVKLAKLFYSLFPQTNIHLMPTIFQIEFGAEYAVKNKADTSGPLLSS